VKRHHSISEQDNSLTVARNVLIAVVVVAISVVAMVWWFRPTPPAVQADTVRYLQLLRTSVSTRDPNAVEAIARVVTKRRAEHPTRNAEWDYFERIIALAQKGEWNQAELATVGWEESQSSRGLMFVDAKR
jgi:hypothetical protein